MNNTEEFPTTATTTTNQQTIQQTATTTVTKNMTNKVILKGDTLKGDSAEEDDWHRRPGGGTFHQPPNQEFPDWRMWGSGFPWIHLAKLHLPQLQSDNRYTILYAGCTHSPTPHPPKPPPISAPTFPSSTGEEINAFALTNRVAWPPHDNWIKMYIEKKKKKRKKKKEKERKKNAEEETRC